jgi:hypothetical protein
MTAVACFRVLADGEEFEPPADRVGVVAKLTSAFLESRWLWPRRHGRVGPSAFLLVDPRALELDTEELRRLAQELEAKLFGEEAAGAVRLLVFEGEQDDITRFANCEDLELEETLADAPGVIPLKGRIRCVTATAVEVVAHRGQPPAPPSPPADAAATSEEPLERTPRFDSSEPPTNTVTGARAASDGSRQDLGGSAGDERHGAPAPQRAVAEMDPQTPVAHHEATRDVRAASLPGAVDRWTPFVASDGRRVRVSCVLEPVFELKNYGRIGNRIARRVLAMDTEEPLTIAQIQNLSRGDIERIDLATIARGLDRLRAESGDDRQLSLIIPVSFISLSHRHGRAALSDMFREARTLVRAGIICEVCDIEGVPQNALLSATSLIKPDCMFLIGRLAAAPDKALGNLRDAGLQAVSFEAPQGSPEDAEFLAWAKTAIGAAKRAARSVMIYRINSPRLAGVAALLGATHASLRSAA